jgi:hypothetical protein
MSLQGLKYVVSGPREGRLDVVNLMCYAFWHIHTVLVFRKPLPRDMRAFA